MPPTPRPAVSGLSSRDASPAALAERLAPILRDVPFPARRWQVLTAGEIYGCDGVTREILVRLPEAEYSTPHDLLGVLCATLFGRPVRAGAPTRGGASGGRAARPGAPVRVPHREAGLAPPGPRRPVA